MFLKTTPKGLKGLVLLILSIVPFLLVCIALNFGYKLMTIIFLLVVGLGIASLLYALSVHVFRSRFTSRTKDRSEGSNLDISRISPEILKKINKGNLTLEKMKKGSLLYLLFCALGIMVGITLFYLPRNEPVYLAKQKVMFNKTVGLVCIIIYGIAFICLLVFRFTKRK